LLFLFPDGNPIFDRNYIYQHYSRWFYHTAVTFDGTVRDRHSNSVDIPGERLGSLSENYVEKHRLPAGDNNLFKHYYIHRFHTTASEASHAGCIG
jgi:hypothetical protein